MGEPTSARGLAGSIAVVTAIVAGSLLWQVDPSAAQPTRTLTGQVVSVTDGDTLAVANQRNRESVRLEHVDAPELNQPGGTQARDYVRDRALGKSVTVHWRKRDRWGRVLGMVVLPPSEHSEHHERGEHSERNERLNFMLLRDGWAWAYLTRDADAPTLERAARARHAGLWGLPGTPIPPSEWRKQKHRTQQRRTQEHGGSGESLAPTIQ